MKETLLDELGSVDTGPPADWVHWVVKGSPTALCGEPVATDWDASEGMAGMKMCPDCERLRFGFLISTLY